MVGYKWGKRQARMLQIGSPFVCLLSLSRHAAITAGPWTCNIQLGLKPDGTVSLSSTIPRHPLLCYPGFIPWASRIRQEFWCRMRSQCVELNNLSFRRCIQWWRWCDPHPEDVAARSACCDTSWEVSFHRRPRRRGVEHFLDATVVSPALPCLACFLSAPDLPLLPAPVFKTLTQEHTQRSWRRSEVLGRRVDDEWGC